MNINLPTAPALAAVCCVALLTACGDDGGSGDTSDGTSSNGATTASNSVTSNSTTSSGTSTSSNTTSVECGDGVCGPGETIVSCAEDCEPSTGSCEDYLAAFEAHSDLVTASCDNGTLRLVATGLPNTSPADERNKAMVGIQAWIQRVPIPYDFEWAISLNPQVLPDGEYQRTTGIGPNAVAVNGVPFFHYERRPEQEIDPTQYDAGSDTVVQGELDQCGGHAGQGEDYHYHYAPVCLLDEHDLSQPIAFSLDGAPIFFGTGGDDYYGRGRFNDWNNLPGGSADSLDLCNSVTRPDGSLAYYTTAEPPYVVGCHRAEFDRRTQINVPPFSNRGQGTPVPGGTEAGEPIDTTVRDWFEDDEGRFHLQFDSGDAVAEVIYTETDSARGCWTFEFKTNRDDASGVIEEYCR